MKLFKTISFLLLVLATEKLWAMTSWPEMITSAPYYHNKSRPSRPNATEPIGSYKFMRRNDLTNRIDNIGNSWEQLKGMFAANLTMLELKIENTQQKDYFLRYREARPPYLLYQVSANQWILYRIWNARASAGNTHVTFSLSMANFSDGSSRPAPPPHLARMEVAMKFNWADTGGVFGQNTNNNTNNDDNNNTNTNTEPTPELNLVDSTKKQYLFSDLFLDYGSHPLLFDFDKDGDLDLILGTRRGIRYFKKMGTAFVEQHGDDNPFNGLHAPLYPHWQYHDRHSDAYNDPSDHKVPKPALADVDDDGDYDLVVGGLDHPGNDFSDYGNRNLAYFENIRGIFVRRLRSDNPFRFDMEQYAPTCNIQSRDGDFDPRAHLCLTVTFPVAEDALLHYPVFADVDGDGDQDLVLGSMGGRINSESSLDNLAYYEKTDSGYLIRTQNTKDNPGIRWNPIASRWDVVERPPYLLNPFNNNMDALSRYDNTHTAKYPSFVDMDNDGDLDLLINNGKRIVLTFEKTATGYTPTGQWDTVLGRLKEQSGQFAFGDVNGDGRGDFVVANALQSSLELYSKGESATAYTLDTSVPKRNPFRNIGQDPSTLVDIDGDGDLDLVVGTDDADVQNTRADEGRSDYNAPFKLRYFKNNSGTFGLVTHDAATNPFREVGNISRFGFMPAFGDIDGDGDLDMVVGVESSTESYKGAVVLYKRIEQTGSEPVYRKAASAENPFANISDIWGGPQAVSLGDIDGDGDVDLLLGKVSGRVRLFKNNGSGVFSEHNSEFAGIHLGYNPHPNLVDVDGDGDLDLLIGSSRHNVNYYRNDSGTYNWVEVQNESLKVLFSLGKHATAGDIDGDGDMDYLVENHLGLQISENVWIPFSGNYQVIPGIHRPKTYWHTPVE